MLLGGPLGGPWWSLGGHLGVTRGSLGVTWGEQVHATVVPRDTSLTESELIDFCRTSLAGYKLPRSIAFQENELPKSGPGKVLKRDLRAPYWVGHERSIN